MPKRLPPLARLEGDQLRAAGPRDHAALSASAGTGKTHVLTARVLRLLLSGAEPSSILCLTFTKAGAAEMADRIHARLAHWVRLEDNALRKELFALDEPRDEASVAKARTLFAQVLDAPGGGLRIQTIHAFAQSLLAAFPAEAGLAPGFRPLEGREERLLARSTLASLLVDAESAGEERLIADIQTVSHRLGEGGAEAWLMACARAPEAMQDLGAEQGIEPRLRRNFGLPAIDVEEAIAAECADSLFDVAGLRQIAALNRGWGTGSGIARADLCERWLSAAPDERARTLEALHSVWARKDGALRSFTRGQAPADTEYPVLAAAAFECCTRLLAMRTLAHLVASLAAGLRAGQRFAFAYEAAKKASGRVDFDDLIRWTERLLRAPGMGDWVRYKLDQRTDHILVDEAQDTNERQWEIVKTLAEEYFAGEGASPHRRTLFAVGDFKQAIFGFQGTDPREFEKARRWLDEQSRAARRTFLDLSMELSFRSSPAILDFVNRLLFDLGPDALGLPGPARPHLSHHAGRAGSVTLWKPVEMEPVSGDDELGEEGWIADNVRRHAGEIARQVRTWIDRPFEIEAKGGKRRPVRPEDILILVRRRGELASLIVARLHAEGVPVAGVDRLLLTAPLAVQDLLAAMRFAAQPLDDLNLASLLVSPIFGWSQERLYSASRGREGSLWHALRRSGTEGEALDGLGELLAMADYATPHQFLETILSGPLKGRRKLMERLGPEARDPIEELLASALDFETGSLPSLQHFVDWFARGDVEIVRDPSSPLDAVRVMTVHGSKGLQAPVVILADACGDPDRRGGGNLATFRLEDGGPELPVFRPRRAELAEPLKSQIEDRDRLEREEHWRLLYVATTRAEQRLFIGGSLGLADRNGPAEASWYCAAEQALVSLGAQCQTVPIWREAMRFGDAEKPVPAEPAAAAAVVEMPRWIAEPAPAEAKPPRPLTPSAPGEDESGDPPFGPATRDAAERGRLLHQLFERLPEIARTDRRALALSWLEQSAGIVDAEVRNRLVADACAVIEDSRFAEIFEPGALAEAPIAAVTSDGSVVAGTVDRLLVTEDRIRLVDFKTGRRPPSGRDAIPSSHLRQMAAYVAALEVIFPERPVEAALLYTAGPQLFQLDTDLLRPYFPVSSSADA